MSIWIAILLLEIMVLAITGGRVQGNGLSSMPKKKSIPVEKNADLPRGNAAKTIRSDDGDVIECIGIYKQPAFDHPALRNHKIQMEPTYDPKQIPVEYEEEDSHNKETTQIWKKTGNCPDGTIPIRKMQRKNKNKAGDRYHMRKNPPPPYYHLHSQTEERKGSNLLQTNHSLTILHTEGLSYYGGKGGMLVWNPSVELDDDYSTSRVALQSGSSHDYESVESGWAVNPRVYGDRKTRLYVYWTVDGSKETGCFDLNCPGFVQTSNEVALGAAIYPISSPTGIPHDITIFIHKDPDTNNWWLQYQDKINIGYWPSEIFYSLRYHAVTVQWGGEVYSPKVGVHPHTATEMGSGNYPDFIFHTSGTISRMRVLVGSPLSLMFPDYVFTHTDEYGCYDYSYYPAYVEDPEFYFGGPGRNDRCP